MVVSDESRNHTAHPKTNTTDLRASFLLPPLIHGSDSAGGDAGGTPALARTRDPGAAAIAAAIPGTAPAAVFPAAPPAIAPGPEPSLAAGSEAPGDSAACGLGCPSPSPSPAAPSAAPVADPTWRRSSPVNKRQFGIHRSGGGTSTGGRDTPRRRWKMGVIGRQQDPRAVVWCAHSEYSVATTPRKIRDRTDFRVRETPRTDVNGIVVDEQPRMEQNRNNSGGRRF